MNAEQRQRASQLVRSQTEEEAIGEAFALLQELVDEQEQAAGVPDGLIQNLVQTAMRGLLTDDDMANLRRFDECCQDSDADGHAVAKPKMKRLELAGVVRSCGFGRHETTAFGDWLLADAPEQPTSVPVLTVECEPDYWSGGHYHEGTLPHIDPTAVWKLPIGTKLYTAPAAPEPEPEPFVWWSDADDVVFQSLHNGKHLPFDQRDAYLSAVEISSAIPLYTAPPALDSEREANRLLTEQRDKLLAALTEIAELDILKYHHAYAIAKGAIEELTKARG